MYESLKLDVDAIARALRSVLPHGKGPIALHEPTFTGNEWLYVKECLDTGWVSSVGKYVDQLEAMLEEYTGAKKVVAVVNGTAGLHICLKIIGVQPGDEVLVPALTFVATANAVAYCSAIPHFVDSEERTLGLDPYKLADYLDEITQIHHDACYNRITGRRIKAVLPVHTFGHPVDLDPLVELCRHFRLDLIEDAAEALGSYYKGQHTGTRGKLSILSFNGNKTITTGGGGAILTNDVSLGQLAKHLTTTARVPRQRGFFHDAVGYNYRLPNINAALGCAQVEQLDLFVARKRDLAGRYENAFRGINGMRFFTEPEYAKSNYWLNVILLDPEYRECQERIIEATNNAGMMTRPPWTLMHYLPMYQDSPRMDLSVAEQLATCLINLPSSPKLIDGHE